MIVKNLIHALSEHDYKIAKIEGGENSSLQLNVIYSKFKNNQ